MRICFDMDGTIADLYGVENWLGMLREYNADPYRLAAPMFSMNQLARLLNRLQSNGYEIGIISWTSKTSTVEYDADIAAAKKWWLDKHLHSVKWDFIEVVSYGTDKNLVNTSPLDILFDDETKNRETWKGVSYDEKNILETLKTLLTF